MPNELLTSLVIAREGLRLLHAKLGFVSTITKKYSKEFAQNGAKVGDTVKVRLPNQFTRREGRKFSAQPLIERTKEIKLDNQIGVDLKFSSSELTLSLDKFSDRYLDPAMSVLASWIETEVFRLSRTAPTIAHVENISLRNTIDAKNFLDAKLVPANKRHAQISMAHDEHLKKELRTRFNPKKVVSRVYRERELSRMSGFKSFVNTLIPEQKAIKSSVKGDLKFNIRAADDEDKKTIGHTDARRTGKQIFEEGETFSITGLVSVHPETKKTTGIPQRFVVMNATPRDANKGFDYTFYPGIIVDPPYQNMTADDPDFLTKRLPVKPMSDEDGIVSKSYYDQSLFYQSEAFCFVSADLPLPEGIDFASRESADGISMRVVRDYDEEADDMITRIDVLYGMESLIPEFTCRVMS